MPPVVGAGTGAPQADTTAPLRDFLAAARGAGLRISPAESIDAVRTLEVVGYADRALMRDALGQVLAKTAAEKAAFEDCFERFFRRDAFRAAQPPSALPGDQAEQPAGDPQAGDPQAGEGGSALGRMLRQGDRAALSAALEAAAEEARIRDIRVFTQVNLFTRRMLERMGLGALERQIADGGPQAAGLREGLDWLRGEARAHVDRALQLFARGEAERFRAERLAQARLASLDRRDIARMQMLVRALARRLATRYSRPRRRALRGQLDVRRTLRRNMAWGGVPFRTVWKQKRIDKPRLMVLCDVSGSVAAVAQFLLLFVFSLREALSGLRAFAFSASLAEVTETLASQPIDQALAQVMATHGFGSSNYGACLEDFAQLALSDLDRQTTVIILGDGRGNRNPPRVELLRAIAERAKQVIWLNPEHPFAWGTGDSDMLRYQPHCRIATVCNSLAQLERVISDVLRQSA
jgi:uncharacterized protein with von Willebrand factor type A (vWA) domain